MRKTSVGALREGAYLGGKCGVASSRLRLAAVAGSVAFLFGRPFAMLQQTRRICRRFNSTLIAVMAGAWLMFGIAPCLMAAPVEGPAEGHGDHDCPHCETEVVVVAAACDLPADLIPFSDTPDWQPALPANHPVVPATVARIQHSPPLPAAPHQRPVRQRYCRLLE